MNPKHTNRTTVKESGRRIPLLAECDVLVAGAGVSGCAAAICAARAGSKVVLVERNGILGGTATAALMGSFCNMFVLRNGATILRGFAGELTDRLVALGAASPHARHPEVPGFTFDCERLKVLLIELCEEAGVQVLTHAIAARPILERGKVKGCFIEGKSGRQSILAKNTVDCTGESDLIAQTGVKMESFNGSASILFQMAPVDIDAFVNFIESEKERFPKGMDGVRDAAQLAANWRERGVLFFPHGGGLRWEYVQQSVRKNEIKNSIGEYYDLTALGMYGFRGLAGIYVNSNFRRPGLEVRALASCELQEQKLAYYVGDFLRRRMPGFERSKIVNIGSMVGYRASRKIVGRARMLNKWITAPEPVLHADCIGRVLAQAPAPHTAADESAALRPDHTTDIPFGVLAPRGVGRILCGSGRSVCQDEFILRNMPKCMILGQAAGVAAAIAARNGVAAGDVNIREVQRELIRQGVDLGDSKRLKELWLDE